MKKYQPVFFVTLLFIGCITSKAFAQNTNQYYTNACKDYGFEENTSDFRTCVSKIHQFILELKIAGVPVAQDEQTIERNRQKLISFCESNGFEKGNLDIVDCVIKVSQADHQKREQQEIQKKQQQQIIGCTPMNDGSGTLGCMDIPR